MRFGNRLAWRNRDEKVSATMDALLSLPLTHKAKYAIADVLEAYGAYLHVRYTSTENAPHV
jgi:hypothetical protein